jgi:Anti-sigma-K factor rskA
VSGRPGAPFDSHNRPPDALEELVGTELPAEELERLRATDALLRKVPAPPELPRSLVRPSVAPMRGAMVGSRERALGALALAASVAAVFFGVGTWFGGRDAFDERARLAMTATEDARGAAAVIRVGAADADGNRALRLEVEGLPKLPEGGYYVLWLARDGEYAGTCGTFSVGGGATEAEWTVSYPLSEFEKWVVTARLPGKEREEAPWLLEADVAL